MSLTSEQLQTIRECARDDEAYQRLLDVIGEVEQKANESSPAPTHAVFDLEPDQLNLLLSVINTIPVSVYVKDRAGRFVLANETTLGILNVDHASDLIGKTDFDFISPERAQAYFEEEQQIMQTGESIIDREIR